jgi:hypothetical protein
MKPGTPPLKSARLLNQVKERVRYLHYSLKTEKAYLYWIRFFIRWIAAQGAGSGWPLAPELLASDANFNARLDGALVPLHWACAQGKAGLVKHMIQHGANVLDAADDGQTSLALTLNAGTFQPPTVQPAG